MEPADQNAPAVLSPQDISDALRSVQTMSIEGLAERLRAVGVLQRAVGAQRESAFQALLRALRYALPVEERLVPLPIVVPIMLALAMVVGILVGDDPLAYPEENAVRMLVAAVVAIVVQFLGGAIVEAVLHSRYVELKQQAACVSTRMRAAAARALGNLGDPRALSALASSLHDPYAEIRSEAAAALGKLRLARAAPSLAGAVRDYDHSVRAEALHALKQTLPLITSEHYGRLGSATTPALCALLDYPDPGLVFALLTALHAVGDARALAPVRRLADLLPATEVAHAARALIPVLEERWRRESDPLRLLRPSHDPGRTHLRPSAAPPDKTLVRPIRYTPDSKPDRLLRPRRNG